MSSVSTRPNNSQNESMRQRNSSMQSEPPRQHQRLLRPPDKKFWQKTRDVFWDRQKKTCFTRTPLNWTTISIYYAIFLFVVGLIFYGYLLAVVYAPSKGVPQYLLDDSPIGSTPCLNYFPQKGGKPIIWLSEDHYNEYVDMITEVFTKYKEANDSFDPTSLGECGKPPFGYDEKSPCVYFRINRILLFVPDPYENGDELPEDMPEEVKALINGSDTAQVWMSCNGTTAKDRDHITQDFFQFQGSKGFDTSGFPFDRQKNYLDPIVALKLNDSNPQRIYYSFTCQAWAKKSDSKKTFVEVTYYIE